MPAESPTPRVPELSLSAAWNGQRFEGPLRTVAGRTVEVIHRGVWTHGFGPDFKDAMLLFDGREMATGSVEIHLTTSGWRDHGHHLDPRYNDVVLHIVLRHDGAETRRADGGLVPVVVLPVDPAVLSAAQNEGVDWTRVGGAVCAEDLARTRPGEVRSLLYRLGDIRLAAKSARLEARLTGSPPGEVLYQELLDALGFSANREPMRLIGSRLRLAAIEQLLGTVAAEQRLHMVRGLLFGIGGFIPFSPMDAAFARLSPADVDALEAYWRSVGGAWHYLVLPATTWTRARVRPANHPALRLATAAAVIANAQAGLVAALLTPLRQGDDLGQALRELAVWNSETGLGADRAVGFVANGVLPFALALAEHTGDTMLADQASRAWERLPAAEANEVTRRAIRQVAGDARLTGLGARGQQGLLHLDGTLCVPRRCYECPIAERVLGTKD